MGATTGRIAKNTIILYARMILSLGLVLYTTRIILKGLGIEDFGIYNLVAGVISMLSFLNAAMTTSTQRYLSFYFGKGDITMQRKVFVNSLLLHLAIGIIIIAVLQMSALFIFNGFLNIPANKISVAKHVYILMSISVLFSVLSVPFTASLNAHENMFWIAIVNLGEVLLKLFTALLLTKFDNSRLIFYALAIALIGMSSFIQYAVYCVINYQECSIKCIRKLADRIFIKELGSFAGWNLFGAACNVGRAEGLAIVLNIFSGTTVNAAYGLALQVTGQMAFFSAAMLQAFNPQIMQSEGAGNRERMLRLSMTASKLGFFLISVIAIPTIFEMKSLLGIWLVKVPDGTEMLCQILIISAATNQLTIGLQTAVQATGNIKFYQALVGTILLFNIPLVYILLEIGISVQYVLVSNIVIELIACTLRLVVLNRITHLSISRFANTVFKREIGPVLTTIVTAYLCTRINNTSTRFFVTYSLSLFVFVLTTYMWGLDKNEKTLVADFKNKLLKSV